MNIMYMFYDFVNAKLDQILDKRFDNTIIRESYVRVGDLEEIPEESALRVSCFSDCSI